MSFFFVCCHLAAMVRQRHHYFCIYTSAIRNFFPRSIPKNKVFAKTQFQSSCIMSTANAKHLDIYLKFEKKCESRSALAEIFIEGNGIVMAVYLS